MTHTDAIRMAEYIAAEVKGTQNIVFEFCNAVQVKFPQFSRQEILLSVCYAFVEFHLTGLMTAVNPDADPNPERSEISAFMKQKMKEHLKK